MLERIERLLTDFLFVIDMVLTPMVIDRVFQLVVALADFFGNHRSLQFTVNSLQIILRA